MRYTGGYFDLQVNGYAGIDFQDDDLTAETLHLACAKLRADHVAGILATIITEDIELMQKRLRKIAKLRDQDALVREIIPGVHIEGPFISSEDGFRGAHPQDAVRLADRDSMQRLLDAAGGLARLVTLAPECDPGFRVTRMLADQEVRVSAGHTDASIDLLQGAIDAGLSMFTHLGNGCPMQMHRHDNIIQRALSLSDKLWLMFIADGAHVAFPALGNYLRTAGVDRCIIVSDAVAPAGMGPGRFTLGRWDLLIGDDLVARAPDGSHLVGSAMTLPDARQRLMDRVELSREQAIRLTVHNPRLAMGYECECGECRAKTNGNGQHDGQHNGQSVPKIQLILPRRGKMAALPS